MRNRLFVALAAAALAVPGAVSAQAPSGSITATANVLSPLTVTGTEGLLFQDVLPGVNMTVAPGDANDGAFLVSGALSESVLLNFTLPGTLTGPGAPIAIVFGTESAAWDNGGTPTPFDPATADVPADLNGSGSLTVRIGGTVQPAFNQASGSYTGSITLTVVYPTV